MLPRNGDRLGASINGKNSWINLTFERFDSEREDDRIRLLCKGKNVLEMTKDEIAKIRAGKSFNIEVSLSSNLTSIPGRTLLRGIKLMTLTHEVGLHVQSATNLLEQFKSGDISTDQLVEKWRSIWQDKPGTDHRQINTSENALYEEINDDVQETLTAHDNLKYAETTEVQKVNDQTTHTYWEKVIIRSLQQSKINERLKRIIIIIHD